VAQAARTAQRPGLILAASDAVGTLGGSTQLPWHAPPRLCGEPLAGADVRGGDRGRRVWADHNPIKHSATSALGASWSPEGFRSRVGQCTQDALGWHRAAEDGA